MEEDQIFNPLFVDEDVNGNQFSSSYSSSPLSDIEQHLLKDDDDEDALLINNCDLDRFFHELLQSQTQVVDLDNSKNEEEEAAAVVHQHNSDDNDTLTKKRKRQLRNKDAALRSRERKKEYVKDLEMKSRYYEGECKRLGSLLQCFMAENQALRFSLHTNNASMTRQESAVLFLESLLLGSLLWLMGIVCQLVVLPQQTQSQLVEEKPLPKSLLLPRKLGSEIRRQSHLLMGKPFKASRSRMRQTLHSLQAVSSNILSVF